MGLAYKAFKWAKPYITPAAVFSVLAWGRAAARRYRAMKPQLRLTPGTTQWYERETGELQYAAWTIVNGLPRDLLGFYVSAEFSYNALRGADRSKQVVMVPFAEMYVLDPNMETKTKGTLVTLREGYEARVRLLEWDKEHCYIINPPARNEIIPECSCTCIVRCYSDKELLASMTLVATVPARSTMSIPPVIFKERRNVWVKVLLG